MLKKTRLFALASFGIFFSYCALGNGEETANHKIAQEKQNGAAVAGQEKNKTIDMQKLSEAFGNFIGRNLQSPGLSFDLENIIKGIREGAAGKPSPLSEKEYEEMMTAVQEKAFKDMSAANLKAANEFMEKNKNEKGIVEIVPGKLQYTVIAEGTGSAIEPHSSPKVKYTGKYLDGTVFGSSEEMGGPITIPLDQTIPGFSKGIIGMKEGEKRKLFVHPDLGYGTTGQLPPNELLIFEIEAVKAKSEDVKENGKDLGDEDADESDEDEEDDFLAEDDEDEEEDEDSPLFHQEKGRTAQTASIKAPQK